MKNKEMILEVINPDTLKKCGRISMGCFIAFAFDPKGKAKMRGLIIRDSAIALALSRDFSLMAEALKK